MSRIGRKPITVPANVEITETNRIVIIKGPKGELTVTLLPGLAMSQDGDQLAITQVEQTPETNKTFGLVRTLINNAVVGVSAGYERKLEVNGVGFRVASANGAVNLSLGFSHPVVFPLPTGVEAKVEKNVITLTSHDKQLVGQVAANIRSLKKPEPYKGKGIKYVEERIRRKAGKTAAKG